MKETPKSLIALLVSVAAVVSVSDRSLGGSISYDVGIFQNGNASYGYLPQFDPSLGPLHFITYSGTVEVFNEVYFREAVTSVYYYGPIQLDVDVQTILGPVVSGTQSV